MAKTILKGTGALALAGVGGSAAYLNYYERAREESLKADHTQGPEFIQPAARLPALARAGQAGAAEVTACAEWLEGLSIHGTKVVQNVDAAMAATESSITAAQMMYMSAHVRRTIREHSDVIADVESGQRVMDTFEWCKTNGKSTRGAKPCAQLTAAMRAHQKMMSRMGPDFEIMRVASGSGSNGMILAYGWEIYQGTKDRDR